MLFGFATLLGLCALVSLVSAYSFANSEFIKRDDVSALKIGFNVEKTDRTLAKREGVPVDIKNWGYNYVAEFEFGSEKKVLSVLIDTGSLDLWIKDTSVGGTFDPTQSTSLTNLSKPFLVGYISSGVTGYWVKDDVVVGDTKVEQLQFGLADKLGYESGANGILGLWYGDKNYSTLPYALKEQGIVAKAGYSIFMNEKDAPSGTILFGAVDKAKYEGELVTVPIEGGVLVPIDLISINGQNNSTPFRANADTGWSLTTLLDEQYEVVYAELEKVTTGELDPSGDFELVIAGKTFKVPLTELIYKTSSGQWEYGVVRSEVEVGNLGNNVLRYIYLVFNLEDRELSFGQARFTDETNVVSL